MPSSHSGIQPKAALSARAAGSESMATTPRNSAPSSQVASGGMAELPALAVSRENDRLAFAMAALLESGAQLRSEEHTSELQSPMRMSYAALRLKKKNNPHRPTSV